VKTAQILSVPSVIILSFIVIVQGFAVPKSFEPPEVVDQ